MHGPDCPSHQTPMERLSTRNEWEYYCQTCDRRYNGQLEPMPEPAIRSVQADWCHLEPSFPDPPGASPGASPAPQLKEKKEDQELARGDTMERSDRFQSSAKTSEGDE